MENTRILDSKVSAEPKTDSRRSLIDRLGTDEELRNQILRAFQFGIADADSNGLDEATRAGAALVRHIFANKVVARVFDEQRYTRRSLFVGWGFSNLCRVTSRAVEIRMNKGTPLETDDEAYEYFAVNKKSERFTDLVEENGESEDMYLQSLFPPGEVKVSYRELDFTQINNLSQISLMLLWSSSGRHDSLNGELITLRLVMPVAIKKCGQDKGDIIKCPPSKPLGSFYTSESPTPSVKSAYPQNLPVEPAFEPEITPLTDAEGESNTI